MKVPTRLENVLSVDPEIMHGDLCFIGTRVPVTVLLENLKEVIGLDDFCATTLRLGMSSNLDGLALKMVDY